jgi:hypothetical protein
MGIVVGDPQVLMLPQAVEPTPVEPVTPIETTPLPPMLDEPAAGATPQAIPEAPIEANPPGATLRSPSTRAVPAVLQSSVDNTSPAVLEKPIVNPAVVDLQNPAQNFEAPPELEPLPPTTQTTPMGGNLSAPLAVRSSAANCGTGMAPEALAPRSTASARPTSTYARALPPRRDLPGAMKGSALKTRSVAPTSYATSGASGATAPSADAAAAPVPTGGVAAAVHDRPAPTKRPVVTTLSIVPEPVTATSTSTAPTTNAAAAPQISSTPIDVSQPAESSPSQGRSGWIFVR